VSLSPTGPNAEQISYWNEQSGPKWVTLQEMLDAQIEPLGRLAMERAGIAARERVVDVGCGCGQTCLQLGERVGPEGAVLGVDISSPMLARARERARQAGLGHVRFENADAQTVDLGEGGFDLAFSRFGVMFFAEPRSAFANLRRALAPGGRIAFVCWQALEHNPWMRVPIMAAARHLPLPPRPEPGAPGPFAFADAERVRGILEEAGFGQVAFEPHEHELMVGGEGSLEHAVDFLLQMGPTAAALRQAGELAETRRDAVFDAVREAITPYAVEEGVRMPSASWIVTALAR
jgi:SAM-dependent methyltransferase